MGLDKASYRSAQAEVDEICARFGLTRDGHLLTVPTTPRSSTTEDDLRTPIIISLVVLTLVLIVNLFYWVASLKSPQEARNTQLLHHQYQVCLAHQRLEIDEWKLAAQSEVASGIVGAQQAQQTMDLLIGGLPQC